MLPKLPGASQRKLDLEWDDLIESCGFDGSHLKWHESQTRRHEAATPCARVKPTPMDSSLRHTNVGEPYAESFSDRLQREKDDWDVRENTLEVVDTIGIPETVALCSDWFQRCAAESRTHWATTGDPTTEGFAAGLEELKELVISKCKALWTGDWHSEWFKRACEHKLAAALSVLVRREIGRTRKLELNHLEYPSMSLSSLVATDGDLSLASTFSCAEDAIRLSRDELERFNVSAHSAADGSSKVDQASATRPNSNETVGVKSGQLLIEAEQIGITEPGRDESGRTVARPGVNYTTPFGRTIDRLRLECGWSFDGLQDATGIAKKSILLHVNKGRGAHPSTLKMYCDAFTKRLNRRVTVAELKGQPEQLTPK